MRSRTARTATSCSIVWLRAAGQSDRLLLDNGDELSGQFVGIADGSVKFETDVGPVDVKIDRVTALVLKSSRKRTPNHTQTWVGLSDGSRLLATQLLINGASAQLTVAGQPLAASQENSFSFNHSVAASYTYPTSSQPTIIKLRFSICRGRTAPTGT